MEIFSAFDHRVEQKSDFSLRQVIGTVSESSAEDLDGKDIEIVNLLTPLVPDAVSGDSDRLSRVLRNLMKFGHFLWKNLLRMLHRKN
jgi:signal transduction histidine kinase